MSCLRYLCLFAYSNVQHILCCDFFFSWSCVLYVASFSGLSVSDNPLVFSNVNIQYISINIHTHGFCWVLHFILFCFFCVRCYNYNGFAPIIFFKYFSIILCLYLLLKILQWNAMLWDIPYSKNSNVITRNSVLIGHASRPSYRIQLKPTNLDSK